MWVFGYGSLMWTGWEAERGCVRRALATLPGYQRTFNKASVRNWGSQAQPCPTLNLVNSHSGTCRGIAFEFDDDHATHVCSYLTHREGKNFALRTRTVHFPSGSRRDALVPIYEGKNILPIHDMGTIAQMISAASGTSGSGLDYVCGIARQLHKLGIEDSAVVELVQLLGLQEAVTAGHR